MYFTPFLIKLIIFFFTISYSMASVYVSNPKIKLFEILGLPENVSIDETLFDLLVEKLEELGIEEEDLSDGYEFMGGSSALNNYINKNSSRLVRLMGGEIEDEVFDKKEDVKIYPKKELHNQNQPRFLFEQFENIETKEKEIDNVVPLHEDIYTIGGYFSLPIILSQTTEFFDKGSASISGFNVVTPFRLEKFGRILEAVTKVKPGILSPKIMFEIRSYYFEKVLSDSVKEVFGGSSYFHLGLYDKINFKGRETDFSFLIGKTHFNSLGFVLTNGIQIPLKLKNDNLKLYFISKAVLMHKVKDEYTGWIDLGISLRYDINSSKITKYRGLIKRRQTIME